MIEKEEEKRRGEEETSSSAYIISRRAGFKTTSLIGANRRRTADNSQSEAGCRMYSTRCRCHVLWGSGLPIRGNIHIQY